LEKTLDKNLYTGDFAVNILNELIQNAISKSASDIHIEPFENLIRIRFRIDGVLHVIKSFDIKILDNLIARLKIISLMDISEKRLPQDGKFKFNENINFRISTLPTVHGEKAVIRIIYTENNELEKHNLGFFQEDLIVLEKLFKNKHGAVIITGPTGSGKTTTLNSFIKNLNSQEINIITVEDPVENIIHGVNQVNINLKINFDFPDSLRAILRQDPDIIMIGEIRDFITADIAIRSAITGHLVLSTLHTNNAISSIMRLSDMGIESFMIAAALKGIISQRLVRKLCPHCKRAVNINLDDANFLNLKHDQIIYESVGCDACDQIGYKGRFALYEYFILDSKLINLIENKNSYESIKKYLLHEKNMITIKDNAIKNILLGNTSLSEVYKNIFYA